jgi:hypothetical protein
VVSEDAKEQNMPGLELPHIRGVFTGEVKRGFKGSFRATLLPKPGLTYI